MKKVIFFLCALAAILIFPKEANAYSDTYLKEISPKLWSTTTLRVWIQDSARYSGIPENALSEWQRASNGCLKFRIVKSPKAANFRIYYVNSLQGRAVGLTSFGYMGNYISNVNVYLLTNYNGKAPTRNQMYAVTLHEIGHALGINGHSSNRNDIMYPDTSVIGIHASGRDYRTIQAMYCR